ncbi:M43 family zinc metalloprotease [Portibacter marinus]|uniref:M43 family zinc metalloprotease n=1 Tax=Portibacter marinus TaxID=2898660 RepID=UPI001EED6726|nr:M43 family zinc metalloprotease [Portibacter marinus]
MKLQSLSNLLLVAGLLLFITSCEKEIGLTSANDEIASVNNVQIPGERVCGMDAHMGQLLQDPAYVKRHLAKFDRIETVVTNRADCPNKVIIPVAIHYQRIRNADINCLRDQAMDQIRILNEDYSGTNSDISNWNAISNLFNTTNGETCIEFCIATKNHPAGYGLAEGDLAVTLNETRGDSDRNWSGYLNIFVRDIQYLGYSPLGGDGDGDGVVVDNNAFASISCSGTELGGTYNLGRTLTHELGHYLLLDHIWGGGCGSDDGVGDTPDSSGPYYGCPANGAATCGSTDMHMNYMDYTDDACMYMFSAGQSSRMEGYVASSLQALAANASNVCGEVGPPPPPPADCNTPTGLSANVNKKKVTLSWDAQAGATFDVRYKKTNESTWTVVSTLGSSVTLNGVKSGSYEFQVKCSESMEYTQSVNFNV